MKSSEIFKGQVYVTKMLDRFASEKKNLSPIRVLANIEDFVIFKRDGFKMAISTKQFIDTFINACGYRLKDMDIDYRGFLIVYYEGKYVVGEVGEYNTPKEAKEACDIELNSRKHVSI